MKKVKYLIYGVAIVYLVLYALIATASVLKNAIVLFGSVSICVALYYEYLQLIFQKAYKAIEMDLNFDEGMRLLEIVKKKDFIKNNAKWMYILQLKMLIARQHYKDALLLMNDTKIKITKDISLVNNYYYYILCALADIDLDYVQYRKSIHKTIENHVQNKEMDPNLVDAIYFQKEKDTNEAKRYFRKMDPQTELDRYIENLVALKFVSKSEKSRYHQIKSIIYTDRS